MESFHFHGHGRSSLSPERSLFRRLRSGLSPERSLFLRLRFSMASCGSPGAPAKSGDRELESVTATRPGEGEGKGQGVTLKTLHPI
jgi:hypothetical protein